jgi:hypothetical protein
LTPFDYNPPYSRGDGVFVYPLANNLTKHEKVLATRNAHSRLLLFQENFPDLYTWCILNLDGEEWDLVTAWGTSTNWQFELLLGERAFERFQAAWGEDDEAA